MKSGPSFWAQTYRLLRISFHRCSGKCCLCCSCRRCALSPCLITTTPAELWLPASHLAFNFNLATYPQNQHMDMRFWYGNQTYPSHIRLHASIARRACELIMSLVPSCLSTDESDPSMEVFRSDSTLPICHVTISDYLAPNGSSCNLQGKSFRHKIWQERQNFRYWRQLSRW